MLVVCVGCVRVVVVYIGIVCACLCRVMLSCVYVVVSICARVAGIHRDGLNVHIAHTTQHSTHFQDTHMGNTAQHNTPHT